MTPETDPQIHWYDPTPDTVPTAVRIPPRIVVPDDEDPGYNAPTIASTLLEAIEDERAAARRKQKLFRMLVDVAGSQRRAADLLNMSEGNVRHHLGKGSHPPRHKR